MCFLSFTETTWHIVVYTSDVKLAGTDANIVLTAYGKTKDGEYKKSDEIKLDNKGDNFEQGQKDSFKVQMDEIGRPYKIRIGHDDRYVACVNMFFLMEIVLSDSVPFVIRPVRILS